MDRRAFLQLTASGAAVLLVPACGPGLQLGASPAQAALLVDSGPYLFFDRDGRSFAVDPARNTVQRVDGDVALSGFNNVVALAFDRQGNMFVLDRGNHRVQIFNRTGSAIGELGGSGQFHMPSSIAIDSRDRVYIADTLNHRVQVLEDERLVASHDGLNAPRSLALWADDTLWVLDNGNRQVLEYKDNVHTQTFALPEARLPRALAVTTGKVAYVSDLGYSAVHVLERSGAYRGREALALDGVPSTALHLSLDNAGNVRVASAPAQRA